MDQNFAQKTIAIIPARYHSTRLEGKPLIDLSGKTLLERTFLQVKQAKNISQIYIATDDQRIANHAQDFGALVVFTDKNHPSGTDRCYEVIQKIEEKPDFILNVQGDEPLIPPSYIDLLAEKLWQNQAITTLIYPLMLEKILEKSVVKVVRTKSNRALYFSRSVIPFSVSEKNQNYFGHIGIYGFPRTIFDQIVKIPVSFLECTESLEQLRWLENDFSIYTVAVEKPTFGVDTPADVEKIRQQLLSEK